MWSSDHVEMGQVTWHLGVLVQGHTTAAVHLEITVHLVTLTNLDHGHILHSDMELTITL